MMIQVCVDLKNLPPLTPEQAAELDALKAMREEDIDVMDVPVARGRHIGMLRDYLPAPKGAWY